MFNRGPRDLASGSVERDRLLGSEVMMRTPEKVTLGLASGTYESNSQSFGVLISSLIPL